MSLILLLLPMQQPHLSQMSERLLVCGAGHPGCTIRRDSELHRQTVVDTRTLFHQVDVSSLQRPSSFHCALSLRTSPVQSCPLGALPMVSTANHVFLDVDQSPVLQYREWQLFRWICHLDHPFQHNLCLIPLILPSFVQVPRPISGVVHESLENIPCRRGRL